MPGKIIDVEFVEQALVKADGKPVQEAVQLVLKDLTGKSVALTPNTLKTLTKVPGFGVAPGGVATLVLEVLSLEAVQEVLRLAAKAGAEFAGDAATRVYDWVVKRQKSLPAGRDELKVMPVGTPISECSSWSLSEDMARARKITGCSLPIITDEDRRELMLEMGRLRMEPSVFEEHLRFMYVATCNEKLKVLADWLHQWRS